MVDDSSTAWSYSGWNHCTGCNEAGVSYYNASQSWSLTAGETATLSFTGTGVKYYAVKAGHHGIAAVSIDGGAETNVDLYATAKAGDVLVWTSPALTAGTHTLRIRNTGNKNTSSSGTVVTLDRADVTGSTGAPSPTPTSPAPPVNFKGVNLNGAAVTVEGRQWLSYAQAQSQGLAQTGGTTGAASLTPSPATDAATASMLNSYLVGTTDLGTMTITQTVANGTYQVHLWFMETVQPNSHRFHVRLEGTQVVGNIGDLSIGQWRKYGPYSVTVSDGVLTMALVGAYGKPMLSGFTLTKI